MYVAHIFPVEKKMMQFRCWCGRRFWTQVWEHLGLFLEGSCDKHRQHIKKQRHPVVDKSLYSQSFGFSSSHVQMWELDHKDGWALENYALELCAEKNSLESLGLQADQTSQS